MMTALDWIAGAYREGWQAADHAWRKWLDENIPDWDAMAGVKVADLPKAPDDSQAGGCAMSDPGWQFYADGQLVAADERVLRDFTNRLAVYSDMRGVAYMVTTQMWFEIDRLRAKLEAMR